MRKFTIFLLVVLLAALGSMSLLAQDDDGVAEEEVIATAHIRVAHFSPGTAAVDVYRDGEPGGVQALEFPNVSAWIEVPAGTHSIAIAPSGASVDDAAIAPADLTFAANTWTTIAAVGSLEDGTLASALFTENYGNITAGNARLGVFHAIEGAPAVNILLDGAAVITQLAYPGTQDGNDGFFDLEIAAGTYDVQMVASDSGDVLIDLPGTTFGLNQNYLVVVVAGAEGPTAQVTSSSVPGNSIYDTLVGDDRFSTLVTAALAAGLGQTLDTGGPFTFFAPTNGAFEELMGELGITAEDLLADSNLSAILLYHVVDGAVTSDVVTTLDSATTRQGEDISITQGNFGVVLNGDTNVTRADLTADNGVIHIINHVLVPQSIADAVGGVTVEASEDVTEDAPTDVIEEAPMEPTEEPVATEEASS